MTTQNVQELQRQLTVLQGVHDTLKTAYAAALDHNTSLSVTLADANSTITGLRSENSDLRSQVARLTEVTGVSLKEPTPSQVSDVAADDAAHSAPIFDEQGAARG